MAGLAAIVAAAVGVVLSKLADVLINKAHELKDVRKQIEQMERELRLIQALLRCVDSMYNRNELVTEWLNQVREIADRIVSVIDTFRVKIEENHPESSNCTCFRKITMSVNREYKTYKLSLRDNLKDIIDELNRLYQRRTDLRINDLGAIDDVVDPDPEPSDKVDDPEVVGLKDDMAKIIEQLLDTNITRRTVLSIVGTGGIGKTTLAQKVFNSEKLEGHFNCRAWLSNISQKYNLNDLWRKILYSVEPRMKKQNPPITDGDLLVKLKCSLRPKRYLIILDDVWGIDFWEELKIALPDPDNASHVIITTRSLEVGKAADCKTDLHKLDYLNDTEGLALLFGTAFQEHIQPEEAKKYHVHLLEVATRLTKKCGGLPLALVVLGGILRRRARTYNAWNKVDETMDWHDKDGEKCMKLLGKSYEDLPDHLKSCFLYFSSFPEDYTISRRHVMGMWMAEEFVPTGRRGTMEDKAEKYFEELVQRCLIQVTKKSWNGIKYCSMHDLLRDLAIRKAKEEDNFFTVFSKAEEDVNQLAAIKPLRAALQFCTLAKNGVYSENTRSLLCFDNGENSSKDCGFDLLNYSGFRLLRVLTLEHVDMRKFPSRQWPKEWLHLRYFGLRSCKIPQDIFKKLSFYNLETIDLEDSWIEYDESTINCSDSEEPGIYPDELTSDRSDIIIPTLRHVYGSIHIKQRLPLKWNEHTNLQTFHDVPLQIELVSELGFCINLRTLVIHNVGDMDNVRALKGWQILKGVLRRTEELIYLSIDTQIGGFLPFGDTKDLPCHGKIQKLRLNGILTRNTRVPTTCVGMFPTNLAKLMLRFCRLQEDPMPILERLQSLRILHLQCDSYVGREFICSTGGFPNLEKLNLIQLPKLCHWDIKERAMPTISHLKIIDCKDLRTVPELQNLRNLRELLVDHPACELRKSMQGKDLCKTEHIPSVRILRAPWDNDEVLSFSPAEHPFPIFLKSI